MRRYVPLVLFAFGYGAIVFVVTYLILSAALRSV